MTVQKLMLWISFWIQKLTLWASGTISSLVRGFDSLLFPCITGGHNTMVCCSADLEDDKAEHLVGKMFFFSNIINTIWWR